LLGLKSSCGGKPRAQIFTAKLTALFSHAAVPPTSGTRENRCETIDTADWPAVYVRSPEALKAQNVEAVDQLRNLEVARLDKLQLSMWPGAMAGDVHAASVVTRVIVTRCRLLGLECAGGLGVDVSKPRTLVVPPVI